MNTGSVRVRFVKDHDHLPSFSKQAIVEFMSESHPLTWSMQKVPLPSFPVYNPVIFPLIEHWRASGVWGDSNI